MSVDDQGQGIAEHSVGQKLEQVLATMCSAGVSSTFRPDELDGPASSEDTAAFIERSASQATDEASSSNAIEPDFEIVDLLGRGGMAEVFRAFDGNLGRDVALKQLLKPTPGMIRQFVAEARVSANLEHANIVAIHALTQGANGEPQIAMRLVRGRSWEELLPDQDLREALSILLSVSNAIAYAHETGFIHRDIKPANVMIASHGQVFVVDWGIAVTLDRTRADKCEIVFVGDVQRPAGTPAYMAPELALGHGAEQGIATDIYLLGACLHQALTGSAPHALGALRDALEHAIASAPPNYSNTIPDELAAIATRAMAREPARRYESVGAFAEAIRTFLAHDASRSVTRRAVEALASMEGDIERFTSAPSNEKGELARRIHDQYTQALFAFGIALDGWPDDPSALRGRVRARTLMLRHAIENEDLPLVARLEAELGDALDAISRAAIAALRDRDAAHRTELKSLREQAKLLDERRVARPLGNLFLFAATAGAAVTYPSRITFDRGSYLALFGLWAAVAASTGALAFITLRRQRSLVSPRLGVTWAAVGASLILASVIDKLQGEAAFQNVSYAMLIVAVGFVAQAMQTRRWLLVPAVVSFIAALVMASMPAYRVELFGVTWSVLLGGVGIALRRGARIDEEG